MTNFKVSSRQFKVEEKVQHSWISMRSSFSCGYLKFPNTHTKILNAISGWANVRNYFHQNYLKVRILQQQQKLVRSMTLSMANSDRKHTQSRVHQQCGYKREISKRNGATNLCNWKIASPDPLLVTNCSGTSSHNQSTSQINIGC